jgi:hypothetical protein
MSSAAEQIDAIRERLLEFDPWQADAASRWEELRISIDRDLRAAIGALRATETPGCVAVVGE